jgi:3-hexulose-6-phosphate synthase
MKLQISFDIIDLDKALELAKQVAHHTDILEVGSLLLYTHGVEAIKKFRAAFPSVVLIADVKIVDRAKDTVAVMSKAGADWITVMAGTQKEIIHSACSTAHSMDTKVMIDLLDASSPGQSALEAKSFGGDALVFTSLVSDEDFHIFIDHWTMVKQNTTIPVYLSGRVTNQILANIEQINPDGLIVSISSEEQIKDIIALKERLVRSVGE